MERESFENEATAKLMNDNFVNIKVDKEERSDVDRVYMTYVQVHATDSYSFAPSLHASSNCFHAIYSSCKSKYLWAAEVN